MGLKLASGENASISKRSDLEKSKTGQFQNDLFSPRAYI